MNYTNIYTPSSLEEAQRLAELFATKNKSPIDLLRLHATFGHHFGSNMAITAQQGYVIRDTPALGADAMAGIVRNSGICKYIRIDSWDNEHCSIELARSDEPKSMSHTFTFSMDMAKRQGIARGRMWEGMPMQMLRARCMTLALRAVFPDVVSGIYSADEIADSTDLSESERAEIQAESLGEEIKINKPSRAPQPVPPVQPTEPPKPKAKPVPKPKPAPISYKAVTEPKPAPVIAEGAPVTIDFDNLGLELQRRCDLTEEEALKVWSMYMPNTDFKDAEEYPKTQAFYKLFCSPVGRVAINHGVRIPTRLDGIRELKIKHPRAYEDLCDRMKFYSNDYLNEITDQSIRTSRLIERWSNPIFAECNIAMNQGIGSIDPDINDMLMERYFNESSFTDWRLWSDIVKHVDSVEEDEGEYDDMPF
jgi:hypothetical protein